MKYKIILLSFIFLLIFSGCQLTPIKNKPKPESNSINYFSENDVSARLFKQNKLFIEYYNTSVQPNKYEISIILSILKNTPELHIHRMKGQDENMVYVSEDGHEEHVFDKYENRVEDCLNMGSYNYYSAKEEPLKHFLEDIAPWIVLGNCKDDPSIQAERAEYYTLDLDIGIQALFNNINSINEDLAFDEFDKEEKVILSFFHFLIFNENHPVYLSKENITKISTDEDLYFKYLDSVQALFKFEE